MDLGLAGRVALVSGGTSGLGRACAAALLAEGAVVELCGRDAGRVDSTVAALAASAGDRVRGSVVDLQASAEVHAWVADVAARRGGIDVVVANGGGATPGTVADFDVSDYRAAAESVVLPHVDLTLAALPWLRASGQGRALLVASEAVRQPIPHYALSSVLRPALLGFARSLADSAGADGLTVNVLAPGYHDTEGLRRQFGDDADARLAEIGSHLPVGRVGSAGDFGATVAFLAGRQAGFVTGTCLLVDGGATRGI